MSFIFVAAMVESSKNLSSQELTMFYFSIPIVNTVIDLVLERYVSIIYNNEKIFLLFTEPRSIEIYWIHIIHKIKHIGPFINNILYPKNSFETQLCVVPFACITSIRKVLFPCRPSYDMFCPFLTFHKQGHCYIQK